MEANVEVSNKAVGDYMYFANNSKGYINNQLELKKQKLNIYEGDRYVGTYESDILFQYDIGSQNYYLTLNDDTTSLYLHRAIFWATKYNFMFTDNTLLFEHEGKKIEITC